MSAGTISAGFAARIPRDSTSPVPVSSAAIESLWFHKNAPQPVRLVPVRISPSWSIKGSIARSATSCLPSRAAPTAGCTIDFSRENAVGDLIEEGSCRYTQDSFMNRCSEENGPRFELASFTSKSENSSDFSIAASARHIRGRLVGTGTAVHAEDPDSFQPVSRKSTRRTECRRADERTPIEILHSHFLPTSLTDFRKGPNVCNRPPCNISKDR